MLDKMMSPVETGQLFNQTGYQVSDSASGTASAPAAPAPAHAGLTPDRVREMIELSQSGQASPKALGLAEILTVAEVSRRVDGVLERAFTSGDYQTLAALAAFVESRRLITRQHTSLLFFEKADDLGTVLAWLRSHYGDLLNRPGLRLHCAYGTPALEQALFARACCEQAGIAPTELQPPKLHRQRKVGYFRMEVSLEGAGISSILEGVNRFIAVKVRSHRMAMNLDSLPERDVARSLFAALLHSSMPAQEGRTPTALALQTNTVPAVAAPPSSPVPREAAPPVPGLLPEALSRSLFSRMEELRDYHGLGVPGSDAAETVQRVMRRAAREGSHLELAAAALLARELRVDIGSVRVDPQPSRQPVAGPGTGATTGSGPAEASAGLDETLLIDEVARMTRYDKRTIRERLTVNGTFREGVHWVQPNRKLLFSRKAIEGWLRRDPAYL